MTLTWRFQRKYGPRLYLNILITIDGSHEWINVLRTTLYTQNRTTFLLCQRTLAFDDFGLFCPNPMLRIRLGVLEYCARKRRKVAWLWINEASIISFTGPCIERYIHIHAYIESRAKQDGLEKREVIWDDAFVEK